MQHIHDAATAGRIDDAVTMLMQDISDYLVQTGVKPGSNLIKEIKSLSRYEYKPQIIKTK